MPRKVEAWGCSFKCGRRIVTDFKIIEKHERTCFLNPKVRACKSCRHNQIPYLGDGYTPGNFECAIDKLPEGKYCTMHCKFWEERM